VSEWRARPAKIQQWDPQYGDDLHDCLYMLSVTSVYHCVCIMSHGPGRIQRQMLQILRSRRSLIGTTELALCAYSRTSLMPWQRVAAWRALNSLEVRGLATHQLRQGCCYWRAKRS
jgi:hypothetical protein